jgi:serine/threonine-protein kinase
VNGDRNIFVTDEEYYRIRKITPQGHVSTLASTSETVHQDSEVTVAQSGLLWGIAVDGGSNVIVTDNHRIHKITPWGQVPPPTLVGTSKHGDGDRQVSAQLPLHGQYRGGSRNRL